MRLTFDLDQSRLRRVVMTRRAQASSSPGFAAAATRKPASRMFDTAPG
jgi:hypothetical protein